MQFIKFALKSAYSKDFLVPGTVTHHFHANFNISCNQLVFHNSFSSTSQCRNCLPFDSDNDRVRQPKTPQGFLHREPNTHWLHRAALLTSCFLCKLSIDPVPSQVCKYLVFTSWQLISHKSSGILSQQMVVDHRTMERWIEQFVIWCNFISLISLQGWI